MLLISNSNGLLKMVFFCKCPHVKQWLFDFWKIRNKVMNSSRHDGGKNKTGLISEWIDFSTEFQTHLGLCSYGWNQPSKFDFNKTWIFLSQCNAMMIFLSLKTCSYMFCMIILYVSLGWCHDNLYTFFFMPSQKKERIAVEFICLRFASK